jgi:hypothetical protein
MGCAVVPKTNFVFFPEKKGDTALTTWLQKKPADTLYKGWLWQGAVGNIWEWWNWQSRYSICFLASFYLLDLDYPSRLGSLTW